MRDFFASIFYIHFRTLGKLLKANFIQWQSPRLWLFSIVAFPVIGLIIILNILFRILDEILFFGYRKTEINEPVFIISNPRSGTTFLHGLMASDTERFFTMKLYHTIFLSITFYKFIDLLAWVDRLIGSPFQKLIQLFGKLVFSGWNGIHPMNFDKSEEDEGLWFFSFLSPAWCLASPHTRAFEELNILDDMPDNIRTRATVFHKNSLQRMQYAFGKNRRFLIKSVMSSGRVKSIDKTYEKSQIIYIYRDPMKTIPSYISMFSASWSMISPNEAKHQKNYKDLGKAPIDFYLHFQKFRNDNECIQLDYKELIQNPIDSLSSIYDQLEIPTTNEISKEWSEAISSRKQYKSKHSYDLEKYGYTEAEIRDKLSLE